MSRPSPPEPDRYLSIKETCERFGFSRTTFYRMLNDPDSDLDRVIVRVPPVSGRIRIPQHRFERWLQDGTR